MLLCSLVALALLVSLVVPLNAAYARTTQSASDEAAVAIDPTEQDQGYSAVLYDNTNGLPTSEANDIIETPEGFIWIGSYSGLIRYDGNTFERMSSTDGIASVVCLYVDSSDRLWVGTNDSGAAVLENDEFRMFGKTEGLLSASVRAIAEDAQGNMHVATTEGVFIIGKDGRARPIDDERIRDAYIRDLQEGSDGILYGVTMNDEVFSLADGKVRDFFTCEQLGMPDIISVLPDREKPGFVYLGTEESSVYHGELSAAFKNAQVVDVSPLTYIKCVEDFQGQMWICADNGIGTIRDGKVQQLENIPLNNSIDHVMKDYEGNLWFTSSRQGVMKVVPNQFADLFDQYDVEPTVVNSTCLLGDQLFVGTDTGLIVLGPEEAANSVPLSKATTASGTDLGQTDLIAMLKEHRIRSIIRDTNDRLWLSTYGEYGLIRYENGETTCFTVAEGMPSDRTRTVYERKDGSMLAACTGGLAILKGDKVVDVINEENGLTNTEVLTACEADDGSILVGTDGNGIFVFKDAHDTKPLHVSTDTGLRSDVIMRVKRDLSRDLYWIVTSNSLAYMDESYQVTTITNFPYSNNFDLYENEQHEMWVISSNGIHVVTVDELLANGQITPVYYGRDNGLPCIGTANSYSDLTEAGELYLAGTTGVAKVNIDVPFQNVDNLKMAVPYVKADGVVIYPDEKGVITIPAEVKKLTVYPYVFNYSLLNPQVTYSLEGFDQKRTTVRRTELAPIDYTNLRGGTYHFNMQVKDAMGHGNKELSTTIAKKKAITETLWFRIIAVALLALGVWAVTKLRYRKKTEALMKKEAEDRLFIREMTQAFAKVIDIKDRYTNGHSTRVADYTAMLTRELGYDDETVERYYNIALLHDIGKIGVPSEVLNKPGKLTDHEFNIIKSHSSLGYRALKDISIMPELATGAGAHHERPDGKGYPRGLTGDEIPRVAQIIAVADTFDAMYSDRPYRKRMNFDKAVSIIREVRGTQLTEDVVDAFLRLVDKGEFRDPNDHGGGTTEDIDNIHRKQTEELPPATDE